VQAAAAVRLEHCGSRLIPPCPGRVPVTAFPPHQQFDYSLCAEKTCYAPEAAARSVRIFLPRACGVLLECTLISRERPPGAPATPPRWGSASSSGGSAGHCRLPARGLGGSRLASSWQRVLGGLSACGLYYPRLNQYRTYNWATSTRVLVEPRDVRH
jgi:hypothetical protein